MRRQPWSTPLDSPAFFKKTSFRSDPQYIASVRTVITKADDIEVCLVQHPLRVVGQTMRKLPNCQDPYPHRGPSRDFRGPPFLFRAHKCRHCRTTSESQGFRYLFTIVDRYTRWPEAVIWITGTEKCARALLFNWIASFGVPLHLTSDRDAQFPSEI